MTPKKQIYQFTLQLWGDLHTPIKDLPAIEHRYDFELPLADECFIDILVDQLKQG